MSNDVPARRENNLRITGSVAANKVMASELLRLVKRSPFDVRLPKPQRQGSATLIYPFDRWVAWVAACYHRSCSRVAWDFASSPASRLEPLHEDLVRALRDDERLNELRGLGISVEMGEVLDFEAGPMQVRGVVKNALLEVTGARSLDTRLETDEPDIVFHVRRAGPKDARRTYVSMDLGGGPRHLRGHRAAMVAAPFRDTLAAQLVLTSGWNSRTQPLVDPMAGGGTIGVEAAMLARGTAVRSPSDLPFRKLPSLKDLPEKAPELFPGPPPRILLSDASEEMILAMIGNLRRAGLTGREFETSIVTRCLDARELTPAIVEQELPFVDCSEPGVFCFNPPYGQRLGGESEEDLLDLYRKTGRALRGFRGWRTAVFVAQEKFLEAWGAEPDMTKPASNASLSGAFYLFHHQK